MSRRLRLIHRSRARAMAQEGSKFAARRDPLDPLGPVNRNAQAEAEAPVPVKKKAAGKKKAA